ncbi:MAG TPA: dioxygenase [Bradyrhizobium sp.]|nr:dioxygenase [Bradyrhizobium sp.]
MRELTPDTITDAVLDQMAATPDPRLKEIMASAVKHLHAFAREVNLSPAEWIKGIEFMTAVGQMCTPERQEFILLSDTLGLSALVNGLHDKTAIEEGTHTSLLGPFYREVAPNLPLGSQISKQVKPGTECVLYGRITDINDAPIANATVSVWQTGADGLYDVQEGPGAVDYRGVFATDAKGAYYLRTVKPVGYSIPMDGPVGGMVRAQTRHGMRPAHIHYLVGAPGYRELVTALYLRDDPHLADDVVFGSSGDLAVDIETGDPDCPIKGLPSIRFDLKLARESAADKASGRVGSDPSAILKPKAREGITTEAPAPAAS